MPEYLLSVLFKFCRQPVGHRIHALPKTKEMVLRERDLLVLRAMLAWRTTPPCSKAEPGSSSSATSSLRGPCGASELDRQHDRLLVSGMEGGYNSGSPENNATRARLLAPILERNEVVGEPYRKRAVTDVNPDTIEVVPRRWSAGAALFAIAILLVSHRAVAQIDFQQVNCNGTMVTAPLNLDTASNSFQKHIVNSTRLNTIFDTSSSC